MPNFWWDKEAPVVVEKKKNVLRWYPAAGKLQVSRPNWTDDAGETKPGKTVVFDVAAANDSAEAMALLRMVLEYIEAAP